MSPERKHRMFNLLVKMGYKEWSASRRRTRRTSTSCVKSSNWDMIPDDVTIQVLVQAREHLIRRTFGACEGAKNVIVHFYSSTSILQRRVVFRKNKEEIKKLADAAHLIKDIARITRTRTGCWEYSPESTPAPGSSTPRCVTRSSRS